MKVKDIMVSEVFCVSENENIRNIAKLMEEKNIGCVPVLSEEKVIGIITDRDLTLRGVADGGEKACQVMSKEVVSISPLHSVTEAARLMAKMKCYRLPVCEEDKLVGIICLSDITRTKKFLSETACAICEIYEETEEKSSFKE